MSDSSVCEVPTASKNWPDPTILGQIVIRRNAMGAQLRAEFEASQEKSNIGFRLKREGFLIRLRKGSWATWGHSLK